MKSVSVNVYWQRTIFYPMMDMELFDAYVVTRLIYSKQFSNEIMNARELNDVISDQ